MPVCYFNADYKECYRCEYEVKENGITVDVEYDIDDEMEVVNGIKCYGEDTKFNKRDILIIDHKGKTNYLLKSAYYAGGNIVFGTPDGGAITKFHSGIYFEHSDVDKISELPIMPKVNKIRIYSKIINQLINYPSLSIRSSDTEYIINLSRGQRGTSIEIDSNNIKRITISDDWNSERKRDCITIDFNSYIEIELKRRENYEKVYEYVNELLVFMQLYMPDKFLIDKVWIMVEDTFYKMSISGMEFSYKENYDEPSVQEELLSFLKRCYTMIPYRKSKTEIRNIPYIVLRTSRSMEDNFLMFYRFIECYYKKKMIPDIKKRFISHGIRTIYLKRHVLSEEQVENYTQEIICLRNHYVHSGYYLKNSSLKISFGKERNERGYTVNKIDLNWIYERTKILYKIVVDIIFTDMLRYDVYSFHRHF